MSIQYVVEAIDESTEFVQTAMNVIKDSPLGAMRDMDRATLKFVHQPQTSRLTIISQQLLTRLLPSRQQRLLQDAPGAGDV